MSLKWTIPICQFSQVATGFRCGERRTYMQIIISTRSPYWLVFLITTDCTRLIRSFDHWTALAWACPGGRRSLYLFADYGTIGFRCVRMKRKVHTSTSGNNELLNEVVSLLRSLSLAKHFRPRDGRNWRCLTVAHFNDHCNSKITTNYCSPDWKEQYGPTFVFR